MFEPHNQKAYKYIWTLTNELRDIKWGNWNEKDFIYSSINHPLDLKFCNHNENM